MVRLHVTVCQVDSCTEAVKMDYYLFLILKILYKRYREIKKLECDEPDEKLGRSFPDEYFLHVTFREVKQHKCRTRRELTSRKEYENLKKLLGLKENIIYELENHKVRYEAITIDTDLD